MLEGLLLRLACCFLPIIAGYSLTHIDDIEISAICPIMFVFTLSTVSCRKLNRYIYRYQVSNLLFVAYIKSGFTWYGTIINILHPDVFLAFTNWISICQHLSNEIMSIMGYLLYYVAVFIKRYGRWRVAFYFTDCLLHSFLVLYIVDVFVTLPYSLTYNQINIKGWFGNQVIESSGQVHLDNYQLTSATMNLGYDKMYIGEIDIYTLDYELITFKHLDQNIIQTDEYGRLRYKNLKYRYLIKDQLVRMLPVRTPFCRREYFRNLGEDVRLKCKLNFNKGNDLPNPPYLTKPKFYWMHRGSKIKPSARFYFEMLPEQINGNYSKWLRDDIFYDLIETRLDIHIIENIDFGEYQFRVDLISAQSYQIINNIVRPTVIKRHRLILAQFVLTQLKPNTEYLRVPVGGMVYLAALTYRSLADIDDLSFHHRIDSLALNKTGDTDSLCPALHKGCGVFMALYFSLLPEHLFFKDNITVAVHKLGESSLRFDVMPCICPHAYGEHRVIMYRNFYNRTSKARVIVEIPHSSKFIILPMESYISTQNYTSELYHETSQMIQNEASGGWKSIWKYFIPGEETVYKNKYLIETALFFLFVVEIIVIVMIIFKVYVRIIIMPLRNIILEGSIYSSQHPQIECPNTIVCDLETIETESILFDIIIISAEEDNDFVLNVLLPFLEKRDLRVCVPARDFTPGERVINIYHKAFSQSKLFITICSKNLVQNAVLNRFACALMLSELFRKAPYKKLLFLKYGQCEIPPALHMLSQTIDWRSNSESIVKFKYINKWIDECLK